MTKTILARSAQAPQKTSRIRSRIARKVVHRLLASITHANLTIIEDGSSQTFGNSQAGMSATLEVHNPHVYLDILMRGDIALGEAYMHGEVSSPHIVDVIRVLVRQQSMFKKLAWINLCGGHIISRSVHALRRNSKKGSKKNITAHYDLGNDFFSTFLDPTMMYSSAIYEHSNTPLEQASLHKLETICTSLALTPDDHLLEIGTGWGGLAIYAAKNFGCRVTTTTISHAQYIHAQQAVIEAGVDDLVTVLEQDYRDLSGSFDKIVSIEMIEAVGHQYLGNYLQTIDKLLKSGGTVLLQAILLPDQKYDRARHHADFIKTHIFPGGFLPSVNAITSESKEKTALNLTKYTDITQSYAYTLRDWRLRFDHQRDRIESLGYPQSFQRLWRFYLAYCEGGFSERAIYCAHLQFEKNPLL